MKIKIILRENTQGEDNFEQNWVVIYQGVKAAVEASNPQSWRDRYNYQELKDLLQKESLLHQHKVEYLARGGFHVIFEFVESDVNMILKIYYKNNLRDGGSVEYFENEAKKYSKDLEKSYTNPGKMMTYAYEKSNQWLYAIINKVFAGRKAFERETNIEYYLPKNILKILESELNNYRDMEAQAAHQNTETGEKYIRNEIVSEPQKIVRMKPAGKATERNMQLHLKMQTNLLFQWFKENYYQIRELSGYKQKLFKKILEEYIQNSREGMVDFKFDNIGISNTGQVVWFDQQPKESYTSTGMASLINQNIGFPERQPGWDSRPTIHHDGLRIGGAPIEQPQRQNIPQIPNQPSDPSLALEPTPGSAESLIPTRAAPAENPMQPRNSIFPIRGAGGMLRRGRTPPPREDNNIPQRGNQTPTPIDPNGPRWLNEWKKIIKKY